MSTTAVPFVSNQDAPPYPVRRFSVAEYHRLAEIGMLTEDDRVELLEGWIVPKMVRNPPHDGTIMLIDSTMRTLLPAGWILRIQSAITTKDSEPEPDLAVVSGTARDYLHRHPGPAETALVIEVADSSLAKDRAKRRMYARARIAQYWIVNLVDSVIEAYSDPRGRGPQAAYRERADFAVDMNVPLVLQGRKIGRLSVRELLP